MNQSKAIVLAICAVLMLGTHTASKAQNKKPLVIEVTSFKVKPGVNQAKFASRDRKVEKDFTAKQPGFIKRTSGMDDTGAWVVIVYWKTMQAAKASMDKFMGDKSVADYAAMIDGPTMKMNRYTSN